MRSTAPGWGRAIVTIRNAVCISLLRPSSKRKLSARRAALCNHVLVVLVGSICQVTKAGSGGWGPWKFRRVAGVTTTSGWLGKTTVACCTRAQLNSANWVGFAKAARE